MSSNIIALSALTLFIGAILVFLVIQLVSPDILPEGLRLFIPAAAPINSISSTPVVETGSGDDDYVPENVDGDAETTDEIDFENPSANMDSEVLAMSSRPEMDAKSDRPDRIPDRIMGVMNGAALIYRSVQTTPPSSVPQPDEDQFNIPQQPL